MFQQIPKNRRFGYARVSSKSQEDNSSLESQPERVDFQNKQQKFFKSGRKKQISAKRVRKRIQLTPEEQDTFNYFSSTGFYKNYQSPKTSPNIFDTRESFLKKMNNPEMRTNFLNSYNNRFKKNN
jgi:hypothetical protein